MNRLIAVLVLFTAATQAFGASFKVNDIRLEGLQRVSASPVFAVMPVRVGDVIDDEDIRGTIRALFATGFFTNVQVARDNDVLIIILKERPAIKSIEIDGNKAIKTEQLTEIMTDNGLAEGEILQRQTLQGIARELERQYIAQARYGASVDVTVEDLPNSLVTIKIDVDEGSAAKIRHINFVGNTLYSDEELLDLFELRPAKWYKVFSGAHKYAREKLTGDIETLESFYLDRGYLDFKIVSSQISISPDKKGVFITLNLNEGNKYEVSEVELAGDPIMSESTVRRLFLLRKGDTFSQARMTATSEYITNLLGNAGYTNASVEGIPKKNEEQSTVEITFFVDPGKRVYVRRISFSGNTKTADEVLRREMRQFEASSASNSRIETSKVRLERLGHFKEVIVETEDVPGHTDLIDVTYKVEEQPSGSIQASIGYSEAYKTNIGVSISERNWLGTGKQVDFSINHNRFQDIYSFNYNDPYFTPDGVSRGFSAFYRASDYTSADFGASYAEDATGFQVNFGYPISEVSFLRFGAGLTNQVLKVGDSVPARIRQTPFFYDDVVVDRSSDLGFRYLSEVDFAYMTQADYEATTAAIGTVALNSNVGSDPFSVDTFAITPDVIIEEEQGFIDKFGNEYNSGTVSASLRRSTLNRGILATRGNSQTLSLEATVPGSDLQYYKIQFEGQLFKNLYKDFTLRFRTKLGYGDGYGEMDELPFFENFRAGGVSSVRGFEPFTLGPIDALADPYLVGIPGQQDVNDNGRTEYLNPVYVLCEDPSSAAGNNCEPGKLISASNGQVSPQQSFGRRRSSGGNALVEFSTELLLPIPFVEDSRSMQFVAFIDSGNVFATDCREAQIRCTDVDMSNLRTSYGLGFKWLSGFGPMTFSLAWPTEDEDYDQTKRFDFSFGTGF